MSADRNLYAPPSAQVIDPDPNAPDARPASVTIAVRIFWASAAATVVGGIAYRHYFPTASSLGAFLIVGIAFVFGVNGFFIVKIARGRNWARIVYLAFLLLSYVSYALQWKQNITILRSAPIYAIVTGAVAIATVLAFSLLFLPASNAWFRRPAR